MNSPTARFLGGLSLWCCARFCVIKNGAKVLLWLEEYGVAGRRSLGVVKTETDVAKERPLLGRHPARWAPL